MYLNEKSSNTGSALWVGKDHGGSTDASLILLPNGGLSQSLGGGGVWNQMEYTFSKEGSWSLGNVSGLNTIQGAGLNPCQSREEDDWCLGQSLCLGC